MPTYVNIGTVGTGSTSVTAGTPASLANTDGVLLMVVTKPDTATINTPSGWTLISDVAGGGGTTGNQVGPTRQAVFFREKDASWTTVPAVSITGGNSSAAIASRWTKTSGNTWDIAGATGVYGTSATTTNASTLLGSDPGLTAGDSIQIGFSNMDDAPTWSTYTISAPGVSAFTVVNERSDVIETTTGNDIGGAMATVNVTTGTSTGAATVGGTLSAAGRGTATLTRLREISSTPISGSDTASLSISDTSEITRIVTASDTASLSIDDASSTNITAPPFTHSSVATNVTDVTVDLPSGTVAGDKLVAFAWANNLSATWTAPAAGGGGTWNTVSAEPSKGSHLFEMTANGSEPSTFTFVRGTTTTSAAGVIVWKIDGELYDNLSDFSISIDTGLNHFIDGVTIANNDSYIGAVTWHVVTGADTWTAPAGQGWTELFQGESPPQNMVLAVWDTTMDATADTGTFTWTHTATGANRSVLFVMDPAGSTTNKSGSDTASLSIADSSSVFVDISASDTSSLAISDSSFTVAQFTATDTSSLAVTDEAVVTVDNSGSDTSSISIAETAVIDNSSATSDTSSLTISEVAEITVTVSSSDTSSLTINDDSSVAVEILSSDTSSLTITDSSILDVVLSSSDTSSIAISETADSSGTVVASDTSEVAITDASSMTQTIFETADDAVSLAIAEETDIAVTQPASDTVSLSIDESTELFVTISASDTASLSVSETTDVNTDAGILGNDSSSVAITESVEIMVTLSADDTIEIASLDSSQILVEIADTDTASLAISETAEIANPTTGTDTSSLIITETSDIEIFNSVVSSDTSSIAIDETASGSSIGTAEDTSSLSIVESVEIFATVIDSDTSSLSISDSGALGGTSETSNDTSAIIITETATVVVQFQANDISSIQITETSSLTDVGPKQTYAWRNGEWMNGTMKVYNNGSWEVATKWVYANGVWT